MLYKNSASDDTPLIQTLSWSESCTSHPSLSSLEIIASQWNDACYTKFDWIEFDFVTGKVFCKVYRQKNKVNISQCGQY